LSLPATAEPLRMLVEPAETGDGQVVVVGWMRATGGGWPFWPIDMSVVVIGAGVLAAISGMWNRGGGGAACRRNGTPAGEVVAAGMGEAGRYSGAGYGRRVVSGPSGRLTCQ
jgi:hypothetical protein